MRGWPVACAPRRLASVLAAVAALVSPDASPASAQTPPSKRLCKPRIEWSSLGGSRAEAQRKAIDGWAGAAAAQHGEPFTAWAIAGIARVACTLTPEGHRCRAAASPCRDLNDTVKPGPGSATAPKR